MGPYMKLMIVKGLLREQSPGITDGDSRSRDELWFIYLIVETLDYRWLGRSVTLKTILGM